MISKPSSSGTRRPSAREAAPKKKDGLRETVESIVIAFVLAFLFRTFEAEAFVIPTGSMGPTLLGRHKDVVCSRCGHFFEVSASEEVDQGNNVRRDNIQSAVCPVCRFRVDLSPDNPQGRRYPSYNGDRILVAKFSYEYASPRRWDVVVFKYPEEAKTNYIKRLVGLPGESVRITQGDIFVRTATDDRYAIARKPPDKILAVMQIVFDNDRQAALQDILQDGWPPRWQPWPSRAADPDGWQTDDGYVSFQVPGTAATEAWLRYQHFVPSSHDWDALRQGPLPEDYALRPQLITDFNAYNTGLLERRPDAELELLASGLHWVGDLILECTLSAQSDSGEAILELVEGASRFQCRFDLATGQATLWLLRDDAPREQLGTAPTTVRGGTVREVRFANVDDQLHLWVDGRPIAFDVPPRFESRQADEVVQPTRADLAPAGIGSSAAALRVEGIRLYRDLYYLALDSRIDGLRQSLTDFDQGHFRSFDVFHDRHPGNQPRLFSPFTAERVARVLSDETYFPAYAQALRRDVRFDLKDDQFFMLGDNSARSKDSRLWREELYWVERELLIGKAFYIYWPHGIEIPYSVPIRFGPFDFRFPFIPNFARMQRVR